jgi:hypothetical protein
MEPPTTTATTAQVVTRRLSWWVPPLLTTGAAAGIYVLRGKATVECDLGINAGTAMLTAMLALPPWTLSVAGVLEVVRRLLPRPVALAIVLLLRWMAGSLLLGWLGSLEGYPSPSPTCADNVPLWWPGWLPS